MAVPGRLPRVVPDGNPFIVEGKVVPPGVSFLCLQITRFPKQRRNINVINHLDL